MAVNSKEYSLRYAHTHKTKKTLADNAKRKRDRRAYEKKHGKIPKWKELDHVGGLHSWKVRVISKSKNRAGWAKKTNKKRRGK